MSAPSTCPMCGSVVPSSSTICRQCGEKLAAVPSRVKEPRFRWRLIPTVFLALMGSILLLGATAAMPLVIWRWMRSEPDVFGVAIVLGCGLPGILWLWSSLLCWRRYWLGFWLTLIAGFASYLLFILTAESLTRKLLRV